MNVQEALALSAKRLSPCSQTPRLDAEVLLAHLLGVGRGSLLARGSDSLDASRLVEFEGLVERRVRGEPVAYLTGHKEFYGLDLEVTPDVLVPRPETESVVDACLELLPAEGISQLADIGTGSGAILVAVGTNNPSVRLFGTEIAPEALDVAHRNCDRHRLGTRVDLRQGDLLAPLSGLVFDVIAANLPYVSPGEASPEVAAWEPHVAVFGGGEDGTATMRRFLGQVPSHLKPGGALVMETAYSQGKVVAELVKAALPTAEVEVRRDLAGYDRIVVAKT